jgi:predicted nucleic acid-binding protein
MDCDIASTFAKIDRIALLKKAFPKSDICITNSVYTELLRAKRIGFSFPDKILDDVMQIALRAEEIEYFRMFSQDDRIHAGEAEGLAIAKVRSAVFLTNDSQVVRFCEENGIKVMDLKDVLMVIGEKGIVDKREMAAILTKIELKDNTTIKGKEEVIELFDKKK